ncbi:SusC/RagA family TonB-linked outer membrane protein [Maribellus comscasis]|uniref:SusC/RagA family TonB-linked outer membrane protein n=1 Tax=Maribellus comscasis TaxID=2681766 RepID=A0A6I6JQR0_9BACT|nr:TonB-dependent receptor [Maribellus comscasis]QGY42562.1 SusC/RagA family TonB-linked outer membrane protein [Maribellus comscasis]
MKKNFCFYRNGKYSGLIKLFKVMRLTVFLLFVSVAGVFASKGYSQTKILNLDLRGATVKEVLSSIEKQSEFYFLYSENLIDVDRVVDVSIENKKIEQALNLIFEGTDVNYSIRDRIIVLTTPEVQTGALQILQQQKTIAGTVTDESGKPLPGVTVVIKGTAQGTVTNTNGEYTLPGISDNATLVFSFVGMVTQEIEVGKQNTIDVTMVVDAIGIDEVVAIGYGSVKKSDITGSISSIKAEDNYSGVQVSVDQMLKGKTAGVSVSTVSSEPGGGVTIRIRGANSITAGNEPLYVIDGFPISNDNGPSSLYGGWQTPRNPLNALNPGDIETIEILKDASATAIYGSRGANGVILITTKNGSGELKIDYSTYFGIQNVAKKLDVLNASEYMQFMNDIYSDRGETLPYTEAEISAAGEGTDWQDEIFRTATVMNHQLAFSGSSNKTKYYASFNYLDQDGVTISSGIKQYTARLNLNHSTDKLNFGININTSLVKDDFVKNGNGDNAASGTIITALEMDPSMAVFDDKGNYNIHPNMDIDNPVAIANTWLDEAETNRTFGNVFFEYNIMDGLKAKINAGSDRQSARRDQYITKNDSRMGQLANGRAYVNEQDLSNYLMELTLSYNTVIQEKHTINAVLGSTYQEFIGRRINARASDFPTDANLTNNLSAGSSSTYEIGSYKYKHQLLSYLGRINYSFSDKYLATASFRIDGSSRFGADNKYGYFPSGALAWRVSNEDFMKAQELISNLKLRASYGLTGNQEIGNYESLLLLSTSGQAVFNDNLYVGIAPTQLGNADLKWETTAQWDFGFDFGILNNRISGTFDYFRKNTFDLLLNLPIPRTSGFTTSLQNVGDTKNTGFDFSITSRNLTGDFKWSTTFIGSVAKNEVTNLGDLEEIQQGYIRFYSGVTIIREGLPLNSYYGYQVEGIFQSEEEIAESAQPNANPGDLRYKDVSEDGSISAADRTILGDPFPDFSFGFDNTFSYKGLELNIFFEGMVGNELLNMERVNAETPIETPRNRMAYVLDRWTENNKDSKNPSFTETSQTYGINSRTVEDASFLRLKSLRLSYSIPTRHIRSLSVFATAQNLFTITNYSGFDPDANAFGQSNIKLDYGTYPLSRIYTIGLNIGL